MLAKSSQLCIAEALHTHRMKNMLRPPEEQKPLPKFHELRDIERSFYMAEAQAVLDALYEWQKEMGRVGN